MDLDKCIKALRNAAADTSDKLPGLAFYLFGSCARDEPWPEDVDVLIVYPLHIDPRAVRDSFTACMREFPLHLFLASRQEAAEHRLVELQNAVAITWNTAT